MRKGSVGVIRDDIHAAIGLHENNPTSFALWKRDVELRMDAPTTLYRHVCIFCPHHYTIFFFNNLSTNVRSSPVGIIPRIVAQEIARVDMMFSDRISRW